MSLAGRRLWPGVARDYGPAGRARWPYAIVNNRADGTAFGSPLADMQWHNACGCHEDSLPSKNGQPQLPISSRYEIIFFFFCLAHRSVVAAPPQSWRTYATTTSLTSSPDHGGQTLGNGRFFSDYQLHGFSSSFHAATQSAVDGRIPHRAGWGYNSRSHNRGGREIKREGEKLPSRPPACASSWEHRLKP